MNVRRSDLLALCTSIALGGAGCLFGPVTDIPCTVDDECPSDAWCALDVGTCSFEPGPPTLEVTRLQGTSDAAPRVFTLQPNVATSTAFIVENTGAVDVTGARIELSYLSCVTYAFDNGTGPFDIAAGASLEIPVVVTAQPGCGRPITVDWFLFFSGARASRGTFDLSLQAPPPPPAP